MLNKLTAVLVMLCLASEVSAAVTFRAASSSSYSVTKSSIGRTANVSNGYKRTKSTSAATATSKRRNNSYSSLKPGVTRADRRSIGYQRLVRPVNGTKPSDELSRKIDDLQSSKPGWLGTAVLIYLLSNHDMSSADKSWINSRLAEAKKEESETAKLQDSPAKKYALKYEGVEDIAINQPASIRVTVDSGAPLDCSFVKQAHVVNRIGGSMITWIPDKKGYFALNCNLENSTFSKVIAVN